MVIFKTTKKAFKISLLHYLNLKQKKLASVKKKSKKIENIFSFILSYVTEPTYLII